jgi:hypothetical protein
VDQARELVAAQAVGAQQEAAGAALGPGRRRAHRVAELLVGRVGRDHVGQQRQQHDDDDDDEAGDGALVLAEGEPEGAQRGGRRGRGDG